MTKMLYFSELTADEQRLTINFDADKAAHDKRKAEVQGRISAAQLRLDARPILTEFAQRKDLIGTQWVVNNVLDAYLAEQQAALDTANRELAEQIAPQEEQLGLRLQGHEDSVLALLEYRRSYHAEPTVFLDVTWGQDLESGIYPFEELVRQELEQTRTLLETANPVLLRTGEFIRADNLLKEGNGGISVYELADDLRNARADLIKLRKDASSTPGNANPPAETFHG